MSETPAMNAAQKEEQAIAHAVLMLGRYYCDHPEAHQAAENAAGLIGRLSAQKAVLLEALEEIEQAAYDCDSKTDMSAFATFVHNTARAAPSRPRGGQHASDCALHNGPALPVGPCDCHLRPA